jgi:peptidyl-prolyl cis-trans isomerase A (cyclophilin A)
MRFFSLLLIGLAACSPRYPQVLFETDRGDIRAELYPQQAPATVANFLRYVDAQLFDSTTFYRVVRLDNQPNNAVKIEVIQGGIGFDDDPRPFPPIAHETTDRTGLRHRDGTLSMARNGPGTASSEFFICVGDQPALDFGGRRNPDGQGFAAFGRVVAGMPVVRTIQQQPDSLQMLRTPVVIRRIVRLR